MAFVSIRSAFGANAMASHVEGDKIRPIAGSATPRPGYPLLLLAVKIGKVLFDGIVIWR
jgi:hypothetical protein